MRRKAEKKPGNNAPRAKVVAWFKTYWDPTWDLIDCDRYRCSMRHNTYPCDACPTWDRVVAAHREKRSPSR